MIDINNPSHVLVLLLAYFLLAGLNYCWHTADWDTTKLRWKDCGAALWAVINIILVAIFIVAFGFLILKTI